MPELTIVLPLIVGLLLGMILGFASAIAVGHMLRKPPRRPHPSWGEIERLVEQSIAEVDDERNRVCRHI